MTKPKLVLYSPERHNCQYYKKIFNAEFETFITHSSDEFLGKIRNLPADVAVTCFCSAFENDLEKYLSLKALAGPLPVFICSKTLAPSFVRRAAAEGVYRLLFCEMEAEKVSDLIYDVIGEENLKEYLKLRWPGSLGSSLHIRKLIGAIIHTFPRRLKVQEFADRLGIKRSRLQQLCQQAFGRPLTTLLRRLWVYQALCLMRHTNLDNLEIATQLDYSEETNMARDFRKELGYPPSEARKRLTEHSPEDLLQ